MNRKVEVVQHNPNWRSLFDIESAHITVALGKNVMAIHHIGSTAITAIYAKPIIDILVEVRLIDKVDASNPEMQLLGYECMGEFGILNRRFFLKNNPTGIRTHHVHIFSSNFAQIDRHLAFRDYMNTHPESAQKYSELKQELAKNYPNDIEGYMDGKNEFIREIDRKAANWKMSEGNSVY